MSGGLACPGQEFMQHGGNVIGIGGERSRPDSQSAKQKQSV
jgi:hypothetical protein